VNSVHKGEQDASSGKNTREETNEKGARSRVVVSVTGMSCVTCARAIEKQVSKLKGVDDVKTAIMLNKVFIDYDPRFVDSATIRKAVDKTGYKSYITVEERK
jgi:Cu+-exporting ATPase